MSNIEEEDIMSEEAFNELIDNFEIVNTLTEYGRKAIKQNVKKLQKRIKELEEIDTANRKVIVEQCDYIQNKSIPVQKVKYKINELKERIKKLKAHKKDKRSVNYINAEYLLDRIEKSLLEEK